MTVAVSGVSCWCIPRVEQTFRSHPRPTAYPHGAIHNVAVSVVSSLELDVEAEGVLARVHATGLRGIEESLEHFSRSFAPSSRLHCDICRRLVRRSQEVVGRDEGVQGVRQHDLRVLPTRLGTRIRWEVSGTSDSSSHRTSTVPAPHVAFHCPPLKLIQFRCPHGPFPTEIRGLSCTQIRKSCFNSGVGSSTFEAAEFRANEARKFRSVIV